MHHAIDRLTDEDKDVRALNKLVAGRHGRYASVVTDIGFDHFLWRNWQSMGPGNFDTFTLRTCQNLFAGKDHMPERVQGYVDSMVKDNWLRLYTTSAGMQVVFNRLRPRLSRPELLDGIDALLTDYETEFNRTFLLLFPRLQALANAYRTDPSVAD